MFKTKREKSKEIEISKSPLAWHTLIFMHMVAIMLLGDFSSQCGHFRLRNRLPVFGRKFKNVTRMENSSLEWNLWEKGNGCLYLVSVDCTVRDRR